MPKVSQALRNNITDQQWSELFQDEKKITELLEYCESAKLSKVEKRFFEVVYQFYCKLVECYSNPNPSMQGEWEKCSTNPESDRREGYFSANYNL